jgi:hypothetical protein
MFGHKHYVPILKGKRAEFPATAHLENRANVTPLFESIPSKAPDVVPTQVANSGWPTGAPYFVDLLFFDDDGGDSNAPPLSAVATCLNAAKAKGQSAIPVTGTGRSPAYQLAVKEFADADRGVAIRLIADDFEDEGDLETALASLAKFVGLSPSSIDLIVDLGSIADQNPAVIAQLHRANLSVIPAITQWRTLTVATGAFPVSLAPLTRDAWNRLVRIDWQAWLKLISGTKKVDRLPAYGDYAIAHPGLPPEGQATILAQLRYTIQNEFMIWKGKNAIKTGYGQFLSICADLVSRPEFRGATFSAGDQEIEGKATNGGSPGNAETWRNIGTNHHIETVLDQIANLP